MTTGTDLEIIDDDAADGSITLRTVRTNATSDRDLLAVWLKSHADGSPHTVTAYDRVGHRFLEALRAAGSDLRHATIDHVQEAIEAMRVNSDGTAASPATLNTYIAAVKSLLGFAHTVGFTRFNTSPLIKLKRAPRQLAQRILSEVDVKLLLRSARTERDRLLLETAYFGGLRISELSVIGAPLSIRARRGHVGASGDVPGLIPARLAVLLMMWLIRRVEIGNTWLSRHHVGRRAWPLCLPVAGRGAVCLPCRRSQAAPRPSHAVALAPRSERQWYRRH